MYNEIEDFLSNINEPKKNNNEVKEEITIDQEFKDRLWALNEDEKENLKQSLIKDGCREPLVLWNNILVDGHNRYSICKAFDIEYRTIQKHFNSRKEVLEWIDTNQLSRRNLLDWQISIIRGRLSKLYKLEIGENQYKNRVGQNVAPSNSQKKVADNLGVSTKTLQRDEKFTEAYEDIERNVGKDKAVGIIEKLTKQDVITLSKEEPFKQEELINKFIAGEAKTIKELKLHEKQNRRIESIINFDYNDIDGIKNCDCLDYIDDIPDNSIDCVITDPPYGINIQFNKYKNLLSNRKIENDLDVDTAMSLLDEVLKRIKSKLKQDAHLYIFCTWKVYSSFEEVVKKYYPIKNVIVWNKQCMGMGDLKYNYGDSYELIIFAGGQREFLKRPSNIIDWRFNDERLHNTQKPVELLAQLIDNSTDVGDTIFDPFLGSGSTYK